MKILQTNKNISNIIIASIVLAMILLQFIGMQIDTTTYPNRVYIDGGSRLLGGLFFITLLYRLGYSFLSHSDPLLKSLIVILPGLIIALNNFPLIAYLNDLTTITEPQSYIVPFVLEALSIGFFEEIVFRGVILMVLLERLEEEEHGIFKAVVISSILFGMIHLLNLFAGAAIWPTMQQVGYSFLMGLLWAVVYLKTKNLWLSMGLHALYNMTGSYFVTLGTVRGRYDMLTIIVTALFGVLGAIYYYRVIREVEVKETKKLYVKLEEFVI